MGGHESAHPMPTSFTSAILLAAGKGERLGGDTPKQFLQLLDRPMLCHSLDVFEASEAIDSVVLVLPQIPFEWPGARYPKVDAQAQGGATRQDSVASGVAGLAGRTELVLVHDAARPLLEAELIDRLLAGMSETCDGVIPGIPLEDSIKRVGKDRLVESEVDRSAVWRIQTPQLFRREPLEKALRWAVAHGEDSPDCSQMLTRAGYRVKVVDGDPLNLKVTRPLDLMLAEAYLRARSGGRL